MRMLRIDSLTKGADNLAKKEPAQYIVEREFLGKFSVKGVACPYREISCKKRTIKRVKRLKTDGKKPVFYGIILSSLQAVE